MFAKLFVVAVSFWMGFAATGCGGDAPPQKKAGTPVSVKTVIARVQPLFWQASYAGTAQPIERVRLSTKLMGWVDHIYFEEGAVVKKGQTLVKIRSEDLEAKQAQALAAISEASTHLRNTETNYKRIQALYDRKAATQKEMDDIETALASARAKRHTAENMKAEVAEHLSYTTLKASFDGIVARKLLQEGDLANPGLPILEIENLEKIKIIANVPERSVHELNIELPVQVQVRASQSAHNGKNITGTIKRIVPAGDPLSRQFDIHVVVDNQDRQIKSGMFARVFVGDTGEPTLMVPSRAVFKRGQLQGLFVIKADNSAQLRWVQTGVAIGDQIEILSGLNPEEHVVVEGLEDLTDGQAVEVRS